MDCGELFRLSIGTGQDSASCRQQLRGSEEKLWAFEFEGLAATTHHHRDSRSSFHADSSRLSHKHSLSSPLAEDHAIRVPLARPSHLISPHLSLPMPSPYLMQNSHTFVSSQKQVQDIRNRSQRSTLRARCTKGGRQIPSGPMMRGKEIITTTVSPETATSAIVVGAGRENATKAPPHFNPLSTFPHSVNVGSLPKTPPKGDEGTPSNTPTPASPS